MTDAQPIDAKAQFIADAKRAQEQREQGIRAQAIKQGRELERMDIQRAAGVAAIEEISLLAQVRLEHAAALEAKDAHWKHIVSHVRLGARAFGAAFIGIPIGAAIVLAAGWLVMGESFRQAGDYGSQMVATGAAQQMANPPMPCIPGQRLDDGRRCPSPDIEARAANGEQP